ncbi:hypothetical protein SAMD00019534_054940 [Acytostelium subglobosum LB1]|uniref:hypothetical protein n=1 Tax=Acytostelium subglobosum LB1 TaxID=1410327 RepID=UPI000644CDF6|nr:hypothetical protein SAMD00019534_054940 [Acytostelium subglobosum LB1]GAM22319.1 hypothetical protein SAMD00019534_054940 [Acytostelium subglobosum LB1]|eukprot:XP_012754439.1 hypothetical protein SAMD00019534_054940 [Acytostelium subglobosum LB1]
MSSNDEGASSNSVLMRTLRSPSQPQQIAQTSPPPPPPPLPPMSMSNNNNNNNGQHYTDDHDLGIDDHLDDDMMVLPSITKGGNNSDAVDDIHAQLELEEDDDDNNNETDEDQIDSEIDLDTFHQLDDPDEEENRRRKMILYKKMYIKLDFVLEHINIVLSVVSVGIFIAMSYIEVETTSYHTLNSILLVFSIFFIFDFVRRLVLTKNRRKYMLKVSTWLDILSLLPIIVTLLPNSLVNVIPLGFLRVLRILMAPRLFKLHGVGTTFLKTSQLLVSLVIFIVLVASMITSVESVPFHHSIYFAVVTLSTVGYGDISPKTIVGRLLISVIILTGLIYIPVKTTQLLGYLNERKPWHGAYRTNNKKFVAVVGNIYERSLNTFVNEYFNNSRIKRMPLVIFSNDDPPEYYQALSQGVTTKHMCIYIKGTSGKGDDVLRANIKKASSIFVFSKQYIDDINDDLENILRVMSTRTFVPKVPIFTQIMNPKLIPKMMSAGATQVISVQELKMNLMAQSCLSPGFNTFIMNLLRSDLTTYKDVDEYGSGNGYEIFTESFSSAFVGMQFRCAAKFIFHCFGMIVFGIESLINRKPRIKLNPAPHYIIQPKDRGILLAKTRMAALRIKGVSHYHIEERQPELEEDKEQEAKVVWKYDPDTSIYRCKLEISEVSRARTKASKKSLRKLLIDKKKEMNYDLSSLDTVHTTMHSGPDTDSPMASEVFSSMPSDTTYSSTSTPTTSPNLSHINHSMTIPPPPAIPSLSESVKVVRRFWTNHSFEDSLVNSVEDITSVNKHIILTGPIYHVDAFIRPLRENYLRRYEPIVILTQEFPMDEWERICSYPYIYVVNGQSRSMKDLKRAGILKCSKLIVMSLEVQSNEPYLKDKATISTIVSIKELVKSLDIYPIYELTDPLNLQLLPNNQQWNQKDPYYMAPSFASGNVFLSNIFDSLLCQSFFNPHLLAIIQILVGKSDHHRNSRAKVFQVDVPPEYIGHRFGYLFESLLNCGVICLALFRTKTDDSGGKFVHTNPSASTMLRESDRLFILHRVKPATTAMATVNPGV